MKAEIGKDSPVIEDTKEEPITSRESKPALSSSQTPSALEKLTFWSFLVGTVLCGIIGLVVTLTAGYPDNLEILITTAILLVSTILAGTHMRWAPVVSTVLGGFVLYLIFTEPFVIESLENPKQDPQGGYGHYIGVVLIIATLLIAFGASLATTIQNYRQTNRQAPRWLPSALSLITGIAIGALLIGALGQPAAATTGTTYTNGVPTVHMSAASFLQSSVTISKGSKLLLVDDVNAIHILANGAWQNGSPQPATEPGAPKVNDIQVDGNSTVIGPFTTAGTYHIYCIVHQGMNLTIIVQ